MIRIEDRYFSLNRVLLQLVGLWPYQKSKFVRLQLICFFIIQITFIMAQLTIFMTAKCTADLVIKIFSLTFGIICLTITYNSFVVNSENVKYLIEQVEQICDDLKDKNEIAIVEKYIEAMQNFIVYYLLLNNINVFLNVCCLVLSGSVGFILAGIELWPDFQDLFFSVNKSRTRHLLIETEYFIDQEKYFYLLLFHINASFFIGVLTLLATGTMLHAYLQYACGMFKIASYRMENTMKIYISQDFNLRNKNFVQEGIIYAVDIHRKAMKFSDYLISSFEVSFMFLIVFGVLTLSLNILRITSLKFNNGEIIIPLIAFVSCFLYMFLTNFTGQEITNHYNYLFVAAYNAQWYMVSLHIQRLILLLLQRSNKSFGLNIGGMYVASIKFFATLMNTSMSYFTVLYSMQQ
ncbi:Odorant receptor 342 [Nylanderia fulva]|uniref:Odorant receptor n=1 Tax=Nylanderia fulva TaxID=613905 RepID=A0A6G1LNT3_9HYME|nr:Odorant receptor 342 [Nylanderia fulva]